MPAPPLILLPGLGATSEIFAPQRLAFPNLQTPEWPDPGKNETLAAYASRMAARIDPGVSCVVGGISFGGILATELCRHLDASHCALISTVRHPKYMPLLRTLGILFSLLVGIGFGAIPIYVYAVVT